MHLDLTRLLFARGAIQSLDLRNVQDEVTKYGRVPNRRRELVWKEEACHREGGAHLQQGGSPRRTLVTLIPLLHEAPQGKLRQLRYFSVFSPQQLRLLVLGSAARTLQLLRAVLPLAPP